MLLIDKGYYDYDFEKAPEKPEQELTGEGKSEEELREKLIGFGFGHLKQEKPQTDEQLQDYILKNGG